MENNSYVNHGLDQASATYGMHAKHMASGTIFNGILNESKYGLSHFKNLIFEYIN